jgi:hypothetical protein
MRPIFGLGLAAGLMACAYSSAEEGKLPPSETLHVVKCRNQKLTVENSDPYWERVAFICTKDGRIRIQETSTQ